MTTTRIDIVLQRMSKLAYAMVVVQSELRSIKCDLGEMKVTNSTNVHVLQPGNLSMPQLPRVSYTDQIHNNPPSQALVNQRLPGSDVMESRREVVDNGSIKRRSVRRYICVKYI